MFSCHRCKSEIRDGVQCTLCLNRFDFPCAGITEAGFRKLGDRKTTWKCSACKSGIASPNPHVEKPHQGKNQGDLENIHQELKKLSNQMSSLPQLMATVKTIQADLSDLKAMKSEISEIKGSLEHVHASVEELTSKTAEIDREIQSLQKTKEDFLRLEQRFGKLEAAICENDQRLRLNNIEIKGVPVSSTENLFNIITKIGSKINCEVSKEQINYIARVPQRNNKHNKYIVVALHNRYLRDNFIAAAKKCKSLTTADLELSGDNKIFVNDHLTIENKQLLNRVKILAKEKDFSYTWVLFKLKLDGNGTLVEREKLPLVMKCPIERYQFDKFRQMCILSGCDYLPSLRGVGLVKAQKFVNATQNSNFAHALKSLPSYLKLPITVTDEYREEFQKAEATFKHQYVYDPLDRSMVRLNEPDDEDEERVLCVNAGEILEPDIAFQLALGNLDPFTLKKMDDWHPDFRSSEVANIKTSSWKGTKVSTHPSIWSLEFRNYLDSSYPWRKVVNKPPPIIAVPQTRPKKHIVHAVAKYVPETEDQSMSIETLSSMYCIEPASKKVKINGENILTDTLTCTEDQIAPGKISPILENKHRSFKKALKNGQTILKSLSRFPRTTLDNNVIKSNFFKSNNNIKEESNASQNSIRIEESPERISKNPFKVKYENCDESMEDLETIDDGICIESELTSLENSQKENSTCDRSVSPILDVKCSRMTQFRRVAKSQMFVTTMSQDSVIENTYPLECLDTPADSQISPSQSPPMPFSNRSQSTNNNKNSTNRDMKKASRNVMKKAVSLPSNQPTLLSMFERAKKPVLKR